MDIDIVTDVKPLPSHAQFFEWSALAVSPEKKDWELNIRIIDIPEMQALNLEYRDQDKPTNVLSIPFEQPGVDVKIEVLGDIAICAPVVIKEAQEQNIPLDAHWAHLLIHGILHLQGYDHMNDEEAVIMEAQEIALLNQLGFDNPYA